MQKGREKLCGTGKLLMALFWMWRHLKAVGGLWAKCVKYELQGTVGMIQASPFILQITFLIILSGKYCLIHWK